MLIELLEDGAIVEESKLFDDPDVGIKREIDVYALVQGKVNGQQIRIVVECVDHKRKMDITWVEKMDGKHRRLKAADQVLLVSAQGFYHSAEVLAKKLGYKTITPAISPLKLARKLGLGGGFESGFKMMMVDFSPMTLNMAGAGVWDDDEHFRRADGSELVKQDDYRARALVEDMKDADGSPTAFLAPEASESERTVTVTDPTHEDEPLHVRVKSEDGERFVTQVLSLTFTAKVSASDKANIAQTDHGNFDGVQFGTGETTFEGQPARLVVAEDADGNWKAMTRWQYEVEPRDEDQA